MLGFVDSMHLCAPVNGGDVLLLKLPGSDQHQSADATHWVLIGG